MGKELKQIFLQRQYTMPKKHMRRSSTSIHYRNPSQTTIRYHLKLIRMLNLKKKKKRERSADEDVEKEIGTLAHCRCEHKMGQLLWRTAGKFLRKLKIELPDHSATPLLGLDPKAGS